MVTKIPIKEYILTVKNNNLVQNITYRQDKTKPRIL